MTPEDIMARTVRSHHENIRVVSGRSDTFFGRQIDRRSRDLKTE
jgi:hypothetical protein